MFLSSNRFHIVVTMVVTIITRIQQELQTAKVQVDATNGWKLQKFSLMSVYDGMPEIIETSTKRK